MTAIKSRLLPRPCEHSLYKRQPKHMARASSGFGGPLKRAAKTEFADLTRMNSELDFSTPAEGNATYTFDKTAIHFERKPPSYVILNRLAPWRGSLVPREAPDSRSPSLAGDNGRCEADGSLTLHRGKTTLDYFKRGYLSSKNTPSAYGTSKCSRMQLVGRAVARWEDAPAAYVTKRRRGRIGAQALIAHVWSEPVYRALRDHFIRGRAINEIGSFEAGRSLPLHHS